MDNTTTAIIISLVALVVSCVSLWLLHLSPFKINISFDAPTLSLYTITPDISGDDNGQTWWIPSFDIGITISNIGSRQGYVHDIRIVASIISQRAEKKFYFYPKWIVDYSIFNQCHTERFKWLKKAIIRGWYPMHLSSKNEIEYHLILEGERLDHKESGMLKFELQIASSEKKGWQIIEDFELFISEEDYDTKSSYSPMSKKIEKLRIVK